MISNPLAPNPTQLMAKLRMMPDQELFQYAQMHQSDPYIFPLTFQESNARKAARSAQQMQPGQPPKVVQQDLQQMAPQQAPRMGGAAMPAQMAQGAPQQPQQALPEDQGIGQLPAQNMQGMAEGGIVGYAPGGQTTASLFDRALAAEGITNPVQVAYLKSIYHQESGSKEEAPTSNQKAMGPMQIKRSTFKGVAPELDITKPLDNMRGGIRYAMEGYNKAKGNPALAATYYYGGPDGFAAAQKGIAVKDPKNPDNPDTLAYGKQVANRMTAFLPMGSANAADMPQAGQAQRKDLGLSPNETVVQSIPDFGYTKFKQEQAPNGTVVQSIPDFDYTKYKQEQARQQADYDAQIKALQNESFLDTSKRIGRNLLGMGEAGLSTLGNMTTPYTAIIAATAQNPKGSKDAAQGRFTPEADAFNKLVEELRNQATYSPRTQEGEHWLDTVNKTTSWVPPYIAHTGSLEEILPSKLNLFRTPKTAKPAVKPGLPTLMESPAAKAVEPAIPDAVKAAREKQAAARTNVQTQVGEPKPAPLSAVEAARAKQAKAKEGLQTLLPDQTNPPVTFPITPESLAAREAAAAKLKAAQPAPAPVEGQTFPIEPDNAGIDAAQRARLALEKQADEARNAAPPTEEAPVKPMEEAVKPTEEAVKPVEETPSAMTPEEMADRARNYEMDRQKESIIRNRQTATEAGLPGLVNPTNPSAPVSAAPDYTPPFMPNAMTMESAESNPTEETPPEDTTAPSTAEAPKKGGMDYNDLMIKMGLGMMAGKSPHALVNVGEAGLGALQMTSAEKKAAAEQAYHEALAEQARAHAAYYPGLLAQKMAGLDSKQRIAVETETARLMAPYRNSPMYYGNLAALQQMESNVREGVMNRILGQNQLAAGAAPVTVPQGVTVRQTG